MAGPPAPGRWRRAWSAAAERAAAQGGAQRGRAVSHHWTWGGPYYNTLITRKTDRKEPTNTILLVQYVVTLFRPPRACDLLTQAPLPLKVSSSALKRPPSLLLLLALIPSLRLTHDDASPRCAQASDQLCAGARAGHEGGGTVKAFEADQKSLVEAFEACSSPENVNFG